MKVALELELAKRMRSATRWVEGQQGMLSNDDEGTSDGFGRMMLVRTGALPANYAGTMGVPGTIIDQQGGANTAGVAVLIKDINGGLLSANTNYSGRIGGYDTGKALYLVGASGVTNRFNHGTIGGVRGGYLEINGEDGYLVGRTGAAGYWWETQVGLGCTFEIRGAIPIVTRVESKVILSNARLVGQGLFSLFTAVSPTRFAYAVDPMGLAAHMTFDRKFQDPFSPNWIFNPIFRAASAFYFNEPYGQIVSVTAGTWPVKGYDPLTLVGYSPYWDGYKETYYTPMSQPLGGSL